MIQKNIKELFLKLKQLGIVKDEDYQSWHLRKYGELPEETLDDWKNENLSSNEKIQFEFMFKEKSSVNKLA